LYASTSEYTSDSSTSTRDFKFLTINLSFSLSIKKWEVSLPFYHTKSVSQSLSVGVSTICELTMHFRWFDVRGFGHDTTVCGMSDLSVMKGSSFVDLLFDEVKCVHCRYSWSSWDFTPFLQSCASQYHSHCGADSFTVSTNSTLTSLSRYSLVLILNIIAEDCSHESVVYRRISGIMGWTLRSATYLRPFRDERKKCNIKYIPSMAIFKRDNSILSIPRT